MTESVDDKFSRIMYNKFVERLNKIKNLDNEKIGDYIRRATRCDSTEIKNQEISSIFIELGFGEDEITKFKEEVEEAVRKEPQHKEQPILPVSTLQEILDNGIPQIKWRVKNLVPERGTVIFGGTSGGFKTWSAMYLALCCATGKKFLDEFDTEKCDVLYIDEENGDITLPYRFSMLIKGHEYQDKFNNLNVSIFNNVKLDTEDCSSLKELLLQTNAKIVIIDSLVRCMVGEEDKSKDVRRIFDNLKPIMAEAKDIAFVILHHTTKNDTRSMTGLRGSGDFAAFADVILMFDNSNKGFVNVSIVKNRHIDLTKLNKFSIDVDGEEDKIKLTYSEDRTQDTNAVSLCLNDMLDWISDAQISDFSSATAVSSMGSKGHNYNTVYATLKKMCNDGDIRKLQRGKYGVVKLRNTVLKEEIVDD